MYSRVQLTVDTRDNALTIPRAALVAVDGKNGVFVAVQPESGATARTSGTSSPGQPGGQSAGASATMTVKFLPVDVGIRDGENIEITGGLTEGAKVITTGAGALRDGDRVVPARGQQPGSGRGRDSAAGSGPAQGSTR
jgi:HlyD family secretion protein